MPCLRLFQLGLLLFINVSPAQQTSVNFVYKHNIYSLEDANKWNASNEPITEPQSLLSQPLYYPTGLTQAGTGTNGDREELMFVSDPSNGHGSVFGILANTTITQGLHMEPVVKARVTPPNLQHDPLVYDATSRSLYHTSKGRVLVSSLPIHLSSHWASHEVLTSVNLPQDGTLIRGLTMDHCAQTLYWSQSTNEGVNDVMQLQLSSGIPRTLLRSDATTVAPASNFQGVHYDKYSRSLLVSYTDTWNFTISSCSIVMLRTVQQSLDTSSPIVPTGEDTPAAVPGSVNVSNHGPSLTGQEGRTGDADQLTTSHSSPDDNLLIRETVLLADLENCYPYDLTADEKYVYWSDWGRKGIMRLSKANPKEIVRLYKLPEVQSKIGWHHGAFGIVLSDVEATEPTCGSKDNIISNENIKVPVVSSISEESATILGKQQILRGEKNSGIDDVMLNDDEIANKIEESYIINGLGRNEKNSDKLVATTNLPAVLEDESRTTTEQVIINTLVSNEDYASVSYKPETVPKVVVIQATRGDQSSYVENSAAVPTGYETDTRSSSAFPKRDVIEDEAQTPSPPYTWLSQYTRHELATLVLVLAVVSMLLFLAVNVLVLKLIFLHRGYRSNLGLAPSYNRYPRHHSSSNGILTSSNYDSQNTTSTSRQDEAKNSLSCSKDTKNCSPSTSIIIDLSQDTAKCGKDVSSVLSGGVGASPPAFKAKKRFGPKRGTIKHLISKSFSGNKGAGGGGGGASCPGRGSDDDGVVLNIEDCCQMTLCETPCYTSVRKETRGYGRLDGASDSRGLLDEES